MHEASIRTQRDGATSCTGHNKLSNFESGVLEKLPILSEQVTGREARS